MIPPAFFKIIEHIPQWKFNGLEADGGKHEQLKITNDDCFWEPAEKVAKGEDI